jgi:hypothetical protein
LRLRYCAKLKAERQVKNINTKQTSPKKNTFGWDFSFFEGAGNHTGQINSTKKKIACG